MRPAHFARCPRCARLLVVDVLNATGRCTRGCGGVAAPPRPLDPDSDDPMERALAEAFSRWGPALDALAGC